MNGDLLYLHAKVLPEVPIAVQRLYAALNTVATATSRTSNLESLSRFKFLGLLLCAQPKVLWKRPIVSRAFKLCVGKLADEVCECVYVSLCFVWLYGLFEFVVYVCVRCGYLACVLGMYLAYKCYECRCVYSIFLCIFLFILLKCCFYVLCVSNVSCIHFVVVCIYGVFYEYYTSTARN
jgi:hypothetical protein